VSPLRPGLVHLAKQPSFFLLGRPGSSEPGAAASAASELRPLMFSPRGQLLPRPRRGPKKGRWRLWDSHGQLCRLFTARRQAELQFRPRLHPTWGGAVSSTHRHCRGHCDLRATQREPLNTQDSTSSFKLHLYSFFGVRFCEFCRRTSLCHATSVRIQRSCSLQKSSSRWGPPSLGAPGHRSSSLGEGRERITHEVPIQGWRVCVVCSFSWLSNSPWCGWTAVCLSIHLLKDIWVVLGLGPSQSPLLGTSTHTCCVDLGFHLSGINAQDRMAAAYGKGTDNPCCCSVALKFELRASLLGSPPGLASLSLRA
jgi:hypothetical protein